VPARCSWSPTARGPRDEPFRDDAVTVGRQRGLHLGLGEGQLARTAELLAASGAGR
jgi:hypothetical protein